MLDQYDNKVPGDLVVLDLDIVELSEEELHLVTNADWYEIRGNFGWSPILVSAKAIDYLTETSLADVGLDANMKIDRIAELLKRWSKEDGFYHA